jgi:hypothetical protein
MAAGCTGGLHGVELHGIGQVHHHLTGSCKVDPPVTGAVADALCFAASSFFLMVCAAVKQDAITAILATPVTAPRRGTVWDWRIRWSSAAATELQPAQVAMRVHYLGTCTARLVAGFNALATNAEKIVYLNAPGRCTYKWSVAPLAPLLFNHQCDWAANGGCRIQASDGNPRFIENANQATMTRAGKAIAIWSEAGGLQVFQF